MTRNITKRYLPRDPSPCSKHDCIYNDGGICDDPFINYGNSDADCFGIRPRIVLTWIDYGREIQGTDDA